VLRRKNMALYRKKPVVVEVVQWLEPGDHPMVLPGWKSGDGQIYCNLPPQVNVYDKTPVYAIKTLEGWHEVTCGDFIITGVDGEVYPCKPGIFTRTYEKVEP
jgi:hypothetical protein